MEEDQTHESTSAKPPLPDDESQPRIKEERKEEDVTPKSEQKMNRLSLTLRILRPEPIGEELRRLIAEFPPSTDTTQRQSN